MSIGFVLKATIVGGCAVYADPYLIRASRGIYVTAAPVVVAPIYRSQAWQYESYEECHKGWHRG